MATPENYNDKYIYLKVIEQLNFLKRLKNPHLQIHHVSNGDTYGLLLRKNWS
jgi:hypothetical protein